MGKSIIYEDNVSVQVLSNLLKVFAEMKVVYGTIYINKENSIIS